MQNLLSYATIVRMPCSAKPATIVMPWSTCNPITVGTEHRATLPPPCQVFFQVIFSLGCLFGPGFLVGFMPCLAQLHKLWYHMTQPGHHVLPSFTSSGVIKRTSSATSVVVGSTRESIATGTLVIIRLNHVGKPKKVMWASPNLRLHRHKCLAVATQTLQVPVTLSYSLLAYSRALIVFVSSMCACVCVYP